MLVICKHVFANRIAQISYKHRDLKKQLSVVFVGEPEPLTLNELNSRTKEWFFTLIKRLFEPEQGMSRTVKFIQL